MPPGSPLSLWYAGQPTFLLTREQAASHLSPLVFAESWPLSLHQLWKAQPGSWCAQSRASGRHGLGGNPTGQGGESFSPQKTLVPGCSDGHSSLPGRRARVSLAHCTLSLISLIFFICFGFPRRFPFADGHHPGVMCLGTWKEELDGALPWMQPTAHTKAGGRGLRRQAAPACLAPRERLTQRGQQALLLPLSPIWGSPQVPAAWLAEGSEGTSCERVGMLSGHGSCQPTPRFRHVCPAPELLRGLGSWGRGGLLTLRTCPEGGMRVRRV